MIINDDCFMRAARCKRSAFGLYLLSPFSRYHPPESDGVEEVAVRRFTIPEASSKREIFILSDLHMGGEWSLEIRSRLEEFLKTLAKTADHYVHSLILLGDIFEMWMTPLAITPPTVKDFLQKWRSDEVIKYEILKLDVFCGVAWYGLYFYRTRVTL